MGKLVELPDGNGVHGEVIRPEQAFVIVKPAGGTTFAEPSCCELAVFVSFNVNVLAPAEAGLNSAVNVLIVVPADPAGIKMIPTAATAPRSASPASRLRT
jgi:hypothetical protein